jgi:hypothetical protein
MRRRPSLLALLGRTLTGLLTVWCLGCSGFDPILGALFGASGSTVMNCASEMGMSSTPDDADGAGAASTIRDAGRADRGFDCGCGGCYSASPIQWTVIVDRAQTRRIDALAPVEPMSVTRTPVVPPPEALAS